MVIEPEMDYEGVGCPLEASEFGGVHDPVRQLRDPAIYAEDGHLYLIYSCAGESGLGIAEIILNR